MKGDVKVIVSGEIGRLVLDESSLMPSAQKYLTQTMSWRFPGSVKTFSPVS